MREGPGFSGSPAKAVAAFHVAKTSACLKQLPLPEEPLGLGGGSRTSRSLPTARKHPNSAGQTSMAWRDFPDDSVPAADCFNQGRPAPRGATELDVHGQVLMKAESTSLVRSCATLCCCARSGLSKAQFLHFWCARKCPHASPGQIMFLSHSYSLTQNSQVLTVRAPPSTLGPHRVPSSPSPVGCI